MDNIPKLDIVNARTIKFICPDGVIIDYITDDKGNIVTVNYSGNNANISVGAQFIFDMDGTVTNYDVKEIQTGDNNRTFLLNTHELTKATGFLTPIISVLPLEIGFRDSFINCYIQSYTGYPTHLVLLYRISIDKDFDLINRSLMDLEGYVKNILHDGSLKLFIFKVPDKFLNDVALFITGKYSMLSELLKSRIIRFHRLQESSMLYKILYRNIALKKFIEMDLGEEIPDNLDLYSMPDPDVEIIEI